MFELFTDGARHIIVRAQEFTRDWGLAEIGTAELLAALTGVEAGEAGAALDAAGVTEFSVQQEVLGGVDVHPQPASGHVPFSPRFKQALERAAVLARQPGGGTIGPGATAAQCPAAHRSPRPPPDSPGPSGSRAEQILRPGHLLLALLDDPGCTAASILARLGTDPADLRESVLRHLDSWPDGPRRAGPAAPPWRPSAGRHRPAGTSRFPPTDSPPETGAPIAAGASARPGGGGHGPPGSGAAAAAAWAQLQRRQARLPLWALRLWRGDMAIRGSEERAARRLTTRLPMREDQRRALLERHRAAVREIVDGALGRSATPGRRAGMPPGRIGAPWARRPAAAAFAAHARPRRWRRLRHLRGWITWVGNRWATVLELWLRVGRLP